MCQSFSKIPATSVRRLSVIQMTISSRLWTTCSDSSKKNSCRRPSSRSDGAAAGKRSPCRLTTTLPEPHSTISSPPSTTEATSPSNPPMVRRLSTTRSRSQLRMQQPQTRSRTKKVSSNPTTPPSSRLLRHQKLLLLTLRWSGRRQNFLKKHIRLRKNSVKFSRKIPQSMLLLQTNSLPTPFYTRPRSKCENLPSPSLLLVL